MKTTTIAIATFFVASFAFAQSTGFVLTNSTKVSSTSCILSDTAVSGKSYRFDLRGTYIGPDSLSSHVIWVKVYSSVVSPPARIIFDLMCPSYSAGVSRVAFGFDNNVSGRMLATSGSGFLYVYPSSGWATKTVQINGSGAWRRMGIALSLPQTETGYRCIFVDNIRVVSVSGDTTMLDNGNPVVQPPLAPTLVSPANVATGVPLPPTFNFSSIPNANKYWVQATNVSGVVVWSDSNVTSTTVTAANVFANNTTYYWRARAGNSSGWSDWSATWSFTTTLGITVPNPPTLGLPLDGATNFPIDGSGMLTWNTVSGATLYQVQVLNGLNVVFDQTTSNTSITPTGLVCGATYTWKVRAQNQAGWGVWSSTRTFSTVPCVTIPGIPTLVSPTNGSTNQPTTVNLDWNDVSGATNYRLQVTLASGVVVADQQNLITSSYQISGLQNSTVYYWRVNASNSAGTSDWSATWSFTTIVALSNPPTLGLPLDGATNFPIDGSGSLNWGTVTGAISYGVQVSTNSSFTSLVFNQSGLTGLYVNPTGFVCGAMYYWRVNATNSAGTSSWPQTRSFSTIPCVVIPPVPTLVSPLNGATGIATNPTLTWNASTGATSYRIQVTLVSGAVVVDQTTTTTSYTVPSNVLANNTTYLWRVNATNSAGTSDWSASWRFTTVACIPEKVSLMLPCNNGTGILLNLTLFWWSSRYSATYALQIGENSSFSPIIVEVNGITGISQLIGLPKHAFTYYWHVRGVGSDGTPGPWSDVWNFMTIGTTGVDQNEIPTEFALSQNYPNPFNPSTTIEFSIPKRANVNLTIYNTLGQKIETLISSEMGAGSHQVIWNAEHYPSGTYFVRLEADGFIATKKMLLLR